MLDKHKLCILMHCIYYYIVSIYGNIYTFGNIVLTTIFCSVCLSFFLQKLHLKKMDCSFDFYFVYRGESSDSMFSVPFLFIYFFTALYFKDMKILRHLKLAEFGMKGIPRCLGTAAVLRRSWQWHFGHPEKVCSS